MAEYNLTPITIKILEAMGFVKRNFNPGTVTFYTITKGKFMVMVQIFENGRWEPFLYIGQKYAAIQNIKDLTDLGDFISYL